MPTNGSWLDPVRACLDVRQAPVRLFVRDDDAGWENDRLFRLIDVVQSRGMPLDLATIPVAVTPALGRELRQRIDDSGSRLNVHQHGLTHANHEPDGRKSEFGASRPLAEQRADIALGRRMLQDLLGAPASAIFTPPWNRCSAATAEALVALGFHLLSRDRSAASFGIDRLRELPVDLDWTGRHGCSNGAAEWGRSMAHRMASAQGPIGLMLHHAVMTAADLRLLGEFLDLVAVHNRVRVCSMLDCRGEA
jgi:predicted deacetylase